MSAQSEAAELAAKAAAKGALHLINWGKKIIPATADDIAQFGKNAPRVKALINMIGGLSDDAIRVAGNAGQYTRPLMDDAVSSLRNVAGIGPSFGRAAEQADRLINPADASAAVRAAGLAGEAEFAADILTPQAYRTLVNPIAASRSFDLSVPRTPESFTNIARSLGERGLITAPKDIRIARQISQLSPDMQQVYFNLLGEGTDPAQLLQALRLMGQ